MNNSSAEFVLIFNIYIFYNITYCITSILAGDQLYISFRPYCVIKLHGIFHHQTKNLLFLHNFKISNHNLPLRT